MLRGCLILYVFGAFLMCHDSIDQKSFEVSRYVAQGRPTCQP